MKKSGDDGAVKEENGAESSGGEGHVMDKIDMAKENQLHSAKDEMGKMREENERLNKHLNQIMKEYQTLQMHFNDIVGQEANKSTTNEAHDHYQEPKELEFISLSLGRTSSSIDWKNDEKLRSESGEDKQDDKERLSLGLDCNFQKSLSKSSSENSVESTKEQGRERSPHHNVQKTTRSEDDEVPAQNPAKRARVSVRVRCDAPTMNDGCQWRKYGQKIAKGNPCPRAYYRCTVAPSCPVRKQVQRCAEDMSVLIITYEGMHNHSLPISATAMASTTSAAASMLLSGSSTSSTTANSFSTTTPSPLHGLKYHFSDKWKPNNQFYLPHSSISPSSSHSTITLDLTSSNNKFSSNIFSAPRYSSTSLNFGSLESNLSPSSWSGTHQSYNNNLIGSSTSLNFARDNYEESQSHSYIQKANPNPHLNPNTNTHQQTLAHDTIAAATKAITSDPSFQSALAVALTSIFNNKGHGGEIGNQIGSSQNGQNINFVEQLSAMKTQSENKFKL